MGKKNVIVGAASFGLGVLIGIMSFLVVANPASPARLFSKLHLGPGKLTTTSQAGGDQSAPVSAAVSSGSASPSTQDGDNSVPSTGNTDGSTSSALNSASTAADGASAATSQDVEAVPSESDDVPSPSSGPETTVPATPVSPGAKAGSSSQVATAEAQAIIADYKQDIGIFFDAWKSQDMNSFRAELSKAYSGAILERHAQQAENYISHGTGMEVSGITFDNVAVEQADADTATLRADYRYTASDYNLTDAVSIGNSSEHSVHVRVNLIKTDVRWVITGETPLNA